MVLSAGKAAAGPGRCGRKEPRRRTEEAPLGVCPDMPPELSMECSRPFEKTARRAMRDVSLPTRGTPAAVRGEGVRGPTTASFIRSCPSAIF